MEAEAEEEEMEEEEAGYRIKNKHPTKRCGEKQGNVVHCGPAAFACFENKHLAISITVLALSVTMDFAPFSMPCVLQHFVSILCYFQ